METIQRNTIQRSLVLDGVQQLKNHPTAEDIYSYVSKKHKNISKATIYNNLKVLSDSGEIRRVEIPNQPTRYDYTTHNHYHLSCKVCGKIFDADLPYDENLFDRFKSVNGFEVENCNLILFGVCSDCKYKQV